MRRDGCKGPNGDVHSGTEAGIAPRGEPGRAAGSIDTAAGSKSAADVGSGGEWYRGAQATGSE